MSTIPGSRLRAVVRRLRDRSRSPLVGSRPSRITTATRHVQVLDTDDSYIDLTSVEEEQFVDLTSSQSNSTVGANNESVVMIRSLNDSPPARRCRCRRLRPPYAFEDDDSLELPPVKFYLPTPTASPVASSSDVNADMLQSSEALKITCPICFDDDITIKREKRKLASTTCGHVFCNECIASSIQTQCCCPVCRKKLAKNQVHLLHI